MARDCLRAPRRVRSPATSLTPTMLLEIGQLRDELTARGARLVAIDGRGGSGKSTLAREILDAWPAVLVIEMDDFYRPVAERARRPPTHGGNYDRERLRAEVLEPLACGSAGCYQRYDWDEDRLMEWRDVPAGVPVLLEGVYSSSAGLGGYADYTIWIECPYELRLRRGVERDGQERRAWWVKEWMPAEDRYVAAERPQARADLVLDGAGGAFRVLARRT